MTEPPRRGLSPIVYGKKAGHPPEPYPRDLKRHRAPAFDRGHTVAANPEVRLGLQGASGAEILKFGFSRRTAQDRQPPRRVITGAYFGDPPPTRAGRAPECEESRRLELLEQMRRELGIDDSSHDRALLAQADEMARRLADRERLAPRRYLPPALREAAE